jgi:hypothetical protein
MGAIEEVRNLMQDVVSPDIRAIKARLEALEGTVNRNHSEVISAITRITDYNQVLQGVAALES